MVNRHWKREAQRAADRRNGAPPICADCEDTHLERSVDPIQGIGCGWGNRGPSCPRCASCGYVLSMHSGYGADWTSLDLIHGTEGEMVAPDCADELLGSVEDDLAAWENSAKQLELPL